MAYPPGTLPTGRTNATPQQDNHPADHNTVNQAVNDIVGRLGANPQGTFGEAGPTVGDSMNRVVVPNTIRDVSHDGALRVIATSTVVTLAPDGAATINFPVAFAALPIVMAMNGETSVDLNAVQGWPLAKALGVTSFQVRIVRGDTGVSNVGSVIGGLFRIDWIAVGQR